jgi:multiple sugar transport system ATP-binding protein
MTAIRLEGLSKSFGASTPILSSFNLSVAPGERLAIVGPSGAGKTTLLRLIAGFETPETGKIFIGERDVTNLPPEQRDIAFVFQTHALYPHLTVEENLAFPLRLRNVSKSEIAKRVTDLSGMLQIDALLGRRPVELSGGEAQRVALGRALIREPAALLMDEPLSSLPPDLRLQLRHEIIKLHEKQRRPLLYVTHDHEEALALGERVAVIDRGVVQQVGTPREVYERPGNKFVGAFVGKPAMNFLQSRKIGAIMGVRPEHFEVCDANDAWFTARIESIQYGGFHSDIIAKFEQNAVVVRLFGNCPFDVGDALPLRARQEHVHYFDAAGNRVEP